MKYLFQPPPWPHLPIVGRDEVFPVRRVYCVGRNYAAHAVEMGHDPDREPPFFFQKNPDNLFLGDAVPFPSATGDLHHEVEMMVALSSGGTDIPVVTAIDHVFGYGVALDMTRRDRQGEAKKMGRPWEVGKAFEKSAPCGPLSAAETIGHPGKGAISLTVNGERRQDGDLEHLIWKVPEIISHLSEFFELAAGDVIFSGTPAGVGPVKRGDHLHAHVDGLQDLVVRIV